ncbi:MAG TPA: hypothetical protein VNJ08_07340 [Bacteriovoracaceae bacterium]|nr:hypothetical protein [Bacteriovoracaceae bacterium]
MKLLAWMLMLTIATSALGQESNKVLQNTSNSALLMKAGNLFSQAKYNSTIVELNEVERRLLAKPGENKVTLGLISYWKGIVNSRTQDFPEAIINFGQALNLGFNPEDLHYEYGQVLFASEKLPEARIQFRESLKRNFKRGVCLYYIGFISRELGEKKKAYSFFKAVEKLSDEEGKEVRQAAETQIGDIYLEQVERHPDAFRAVESYVIPQYQKALALNTESPMAPKIHEKIVNLQRKYDLVLFQLRNGRPTLQPPYFMRLAAEYGVDSNVTFSPNQTTVAKSRQSSSYGRTAAMGRYTFYHEDFFSVSPEINFTYTRYLNRVPEIYRNDNYFLGPSLRTAYEHKLFKKPASILADYEYNEIKRDIDSEEKLKFNSRSHGLMFGERFNYFQRGESVARLRHRVTDSYLDTSDSNTTSLILEQVWGLTTNTLLFYFSYDRLRMKDTTFNTDSFMFRGDMIMSRVRDWFTPSVGLGLTSVDPINDRDNRGRELLINPNARISKTFMKNWRGNLKYDYQQNNSKDEDSFAYKKSLYSFELEYIF